MGDVLAIEFDRAGPRPRLANTVIIKVDFPRRCAGSAHDLAGLDLEVDAPAPRILP